MDILSSFREAIANGLNEFAEYRQLSLDEQRFDDCRHYTKEDGIRYYGDMPATVFFFYQMTNYGRFFYRKVDNATDTKLRQFIAETAPICVHVCENGEYMLDRHASAWRVHLHEPPAIEGELHPQYKELAPDIPCIGYGGFDDWACTEGLYCFAHRNFETPYFRLCCGLLDEGKHAEKIVEIDTDRELREEILKMFWEQTMYYGEQIFCWAMAAEEPEEGHVFWQGGHVPR